MNDHEGKEVICDEEDNTVWDAVDWDSGGYSTGEYGV